MSTKALGYMNEDEIKEIEAKYNETKKRMEEIKESRRLRIEARNQGKPKKSLMRNITINIPDNYEVNIQKLIAMKLVASRSEAVRTAIREFLNREYDKNLELLGFFKK